MEADTAQASDTSPLSSPTRRQQLQAAPGGDAWKFAGSAPPPGLAARRGSQSARARRFVVNENAPQVIAPAPPALPPQPPPQPRARPPPRLAPAGATQSSKAGVENSDDSESERSSGSDAHASSDDSEQSSPDTSHDASTRSNSPTLPARKVVAADVDESILSPFATEAPCLGAEAEYVCKRGSADQGRSLSNGTRRPPALSIHESSDTTQRTGSFSHPPSPFSPPAGETAAYLGARKCVLGSPQNMAGDLSEDDTKIGGAVEEEERRNEDDDEGGATEERGASAQDARALLIAGLEDDTRTKLLSDWARRQQDSEARLQNLLSSSATRPSSASSAVRPGSSMSSCSVASAGSGRGETDDVRRERRERKRERVAALLADEARVAEIVQQHVKECSGKQAQASEAAGEESGDGEARNDRQAEESKKAVPESVIRERLRLLALRADGMDDDGAERRGDLGGLADVFRGGEATAPASNWDLRDIQTGDVVHNEVIADIDFDTAFPGDGKRATGASGRQPMGVDRDCDGHEMLRPGPGGVLQRQPGAHGEGAYPACEASDEEEVNERQLEDAAYLRLLTSADTRRNGARQGGCSDASEVWQPGGKVRAAFMRNQYGAESEVEEEAAADAMQDGATGSQLLEAQGVLQAASSLVSDFTAALKVRKKGSAVRSLMRDLSHAAQAAESPSECQARKNHPPPLVATGGGECGKATSQGEGDGEAGELGRSWRLAESFLLVGQVYKRSSADGWGGVARWRKRLALLRVGTCACGGGARARRNDDVCLYLFRPLPKEHKGGSLLRFLSRKGSVPSTGSSSTTSGASSAASTPTHVDDVLQILSQVPRRVRGRDVLDVLEPVDIGEPVSRAALAVSCADPEAKGGCSMLKVCLSTRAEKDMWLQALKTGISLTSSGDGACRSPRKCSKNDAKARRGRAPALTPALERTRPAEKEEAAAPATVAERGLASPAKVLVDADNSAQNVAALRRFGGSCSDGLGYVES